MNSAYEISHELTEIDWWRLADVMARAPLCERKPFELATAFRNSYAVVFARSHGRLIGAARATSDGVFYASIFDVVVSPEHQGKGVGRLMVSALIARLPVDKIFLSSVFGKEAFYAKLGFLAHNNAMGLYREPARSEAIGRGVLTGPDTASSFATGRPPS